VDNLLVTDEEVYDGRSDDELDDEFGTLPKYNISDASFFTEGAAVRLLLLTAVVFCGYFCWLFLESKVIKFY